MAYATFYLNGTSLSNATSVFTDSALTTLAADGYYSDGAVSRRQVNGVLEDVANCPSCNPPCIFSLSLFYTEPTGSQPRDIEFNDTGSKVFIVSDGSDRIEEYPLSSNYNLSTIGTMTASFTISEDATPTSVSFNASGTRMFVLGDTNNTVYEYTLSAGFDLTSPPVYTTESYSVASELGTDVSGLDFNPTGMQFYVTDSVVSKVGAWSLSVAFDLSSTVTFLGSTSIEASPSDLKWDSSGDNILFAHSNGFISKYEASTSYDIDTLILSGDKIDISYVDTTPSGITLNSSGNRLYITGDENDSIYEFSLDCDGVCLGYQFDTSYSTTEVPITPSSSSGVQFNGDGTNIIVSGRNGLLYEYSLSTPYDIGSTVAFVRSLNLSPRNTLLLGFSWNNDGTKLFTVDTQPTDEVNEYTVSAPYDIGSVVSFAGSYSVVTQTLGPSGICFNPTGTIMLISEFDSNRILEYTLSTGFDLTSTVSFSNEYSVSSEGSPYDVIFNNNGTLMFVLIVTTPPRVITYSLSTPYDISSTVEKICEIYLTDQVGSAFPGGICFSPDFITLEVSADDGKIYQYETT